MAKQNEVDKGYLAFRSKLINDYSEDPQRQIRWQIEALEDIIPIAKKSDTEDSKINTYIKKLEDELQDLKSMVVNDLSS